MRYYYKAHISRRYASGLQRCAVYEFFQTRAASEVQYSETELDHSSVLIKQRHNVSYGANSNQIENFCKNMPLQSPFLLQRLGDLKRHSAPCQIPERINRVGTFGIDHDTFCIVSVIL